MGARSVPLSTRVRSSVAVALLPLVVLTACVGGDPASTPADRAAPATPVAPSAASSGPASSIAPAADVTRPAGSPRACDLLTAADVASATGAPVSAGEGTESARRSVCAFTASRPGGPGVTLGVEPAERFDAKADASRRSVGVPGESVDGLGARAVFFYSDADLPEGVGGVLVRSGTSTLDVTLQGLGDRDRTRQAAVAVATTALAGL